LYSSGRLDYYKGVSELGRYSVIVGYCHDLKPAGALLDVGCGVGILQERLNSSNYSCYVGIDRSKEAIGRAASRQDEKTFFVLADVNVYLPTRKFDVIIFNESLYHIEDPISLVKRYENYLNDNGHFVISICDSEKTKALWKMLDAVYPIQDEVQIRHKSLLSWTVKVITPLKA